MKNMVYEVRGDGRNWFYLHQFRKVVMTQHMAFYTDAAASMVECGIRGIWRWPTEYPAKRN